MCVNDNGTRPDGLNACEGIEMSYEPIPTEGGRDWTVKLLEEIVEEIADLASRLQSLTRHIDYITRKETR